MMHTGAATQASVVLCAARSMVRLPLKRALPIGYAITASFNPQKLGPLPDVAMHPAHFGVTPVSAPLKGFGRRQRGKLVLLAGLPISATRAVAELAASSGCQAPHE